jgi:Plasmid pRiA4b ORF-3-like protein
MSQQAYVFKAALDGDPDVSRTVAVGADGTLADLHDVLRQAFEWHGDFPYSFRLDDGREYIATPGDAAEVPLAPLELEPDQPIQHVVEGPEEWRFALALLEVRADDDPLPRVLERRGEIALEPEVELGAGG